MKTTKQRKRRSRRVEKTIAQDLGGRLTFNSGAGDEKADCRVPHRYKGSAQGVVEATAIAIRVESKTTEKSKYTMMARDWADLWRSASLQGEIPVFHIQLDTHRDPLDLAFVTSALMAEFTEDIAPSDGSSRAIVINRERGESLIPSQTVKIPHHRFDLVGDGGRHYSVCLCLYSVLRSHLHNLGLP